MGKFITNTSVRHLYHSLHMEDGKKNDSFTDLDAMLNFFKHTENIRFIVLWDVHHQDSNNSKLFSLTKKDKYQYNNKDLTNSPNVGMLKK